MSGMTARPDLDLAAAPDPDGYPPPMYQVRPYPVCIEEGPTYSELMQALSDALVGWHNLIYRTHWPMLRNYEDAEVYERMAEVLTSAAGHHPELVVPYRPSETPTQTDPICPSLGRPLTDDEVCDIAVASGWIEDTPEARAAYLTEGE